MISLPAGVFNPYSGVKTSILVLDKRLAKKTDAILFAKISNDGYNLGAQRRPIDKNDLPAAVHNIKGWLESVRSGVVFDVDSFANLSLVAKVKIGENGEYGLSVDRYSEVISGCTAYPMMKLGELCIIERGGSPRPIQDYITNEKDGVNWIKIGDAASGSKYISQTKEKIKPEGATKSRSVKPGDFILSNSMSFGRPYIMDTYGCIHDGWLLLREISPNLLKDYLYSILSSDFVYQQFKRSATGGVVNNLNSELVRNVEIPLPPLEVQKEIVAEIKGYQKIIDGARQVVENYQPCISIHPGWPMIELGIVCRIGGTITKSVNKKLPYIGADSLESNTGYLLQIKTAKEQAVSGPVYEFIGRRLLYSKIRPYLNKLTIVDFEGYCSSDMYPLIIDETRAIDTYLAYFMLSAHFNESIREFYERASIPKINREQLFSIKAPLPTLDEQRAIVAQIEAEQRLVNANKELIRIFEDKVKAVINRAWGEIA